MRYIFLSNIRLIGSIIDNHRAHFVGVIHPFLKLRFCNGRTRGIIRKAQVDNIWRLFRQLRSKAGFLCAGHIDDITPCFRLYIISPGAPRHNICVYVYRIDRITHGYLVILREYLLNISGITFCPVGDKYLICPDITPSFLIVVFRHGTSQKLVTKIRRVPAECLCMRHLVYCSVQAFDNSRRQRLRHIPDSQTDNPFIRIRLCICRYFFSDGGEKITPRQFQIIFIYSKHLPKFLLLLYINLSVKYDRRRACHIDHIRLPVPLHLKVAA